MRRRAFRLIGALGLVGLWGAPGFGAAGEHEVPAPNLAAEASPDPRAQTEATLQEMWQRRILSTEARQWSPDDLQLLERMREAERYGAVSLLRRKAGGLAALTVAFKTQPGEPPELKLTREGYERWLTLRSQEAIEYFERKGVLTRWMFFLVDLDGHKLFDGGGRLTPRGEYVYDLASVNMPVWWKVPQTGEVFGTRPPPKP